MELDPDLLKKYYKGLCSAEEKAIVEAWQASIDADEPAQMDDAERLELESEMWRHLQHSVLPGIDDIRPEKSRASGIKRVSKYGIAAAVILLTGAVGLYFHNKNVVKQEPATVTWQTVSTTGAQKKQVVLEDGTRIMLNNESSLRYPTHFSSKARLVYLTGEGYFQVAKDHKRPFSILTPQTRTQVLGTVFDLKAYHGEPASLAVEEGRVRFGLLSDHHIHQLFTKGQYGVFNTNGQLTRAGVGIDEVSPWKDNRILFNAEPLEKIIPVLQRWFNVRIRVNDRALLKQSFTGEFNNPSINFLLDRIGFVMKFSYTVQQQTITINPKN